MTAFEWVVMVLAIAFAVLLVIAIIFSIYLTKLTKRLNHISEKADRVADNVEAASSFFRQSAGPVAITKFLSNIVETVNNVAEAKNKKAKKSKKGKKDE